MSVPLANSFVRGLLEKQIPSPKQDLKKAYKQTIYTGVTSNTTTARESTGD